MYKFLILCGRYRVFSSLSFYHGLDMFLCNEGRFGHKRKLPGFFTISNVWVSCVALLYGEEQNFVRQRRDGLQNARPYRIS